MNGRNRIAPRFTKVAFLVLADLSSNSTSRRALERGASSRSRARNLLTSCASGSIKIPGSIDGSKDPDLIPDDTAYRLFFQAVCEPETATAVQKARQIAKLRPIGLNPEDLVTLTRLLVDFDRRRSAIEADTQVMRAAAAGVYDQKQVAQLEERFARLVAESRSAIAVRLSSSGAARVHHHVMSLKSKMVMIPAASSPSE